MTLQIKILVVIVDRDLTYEPYRYFSASYFLSSISISARKMQSVRAQNIGTEILGLISSQVMLLNFCYYQVCKNLKLCVCVCVCDR